MSSPDWDDAVFLYFTKSPVRSVQIFYIYVFVIPCFKKFVYLFIVSIYIVRLLNDSLKYNCLFQVMFLSKIIILVNQGILDPALLFKIVLDRLCLYFGDTALSETRIVIVLG